MTVVAGPRSTGLMLLARLACAIMGIAFVILAVAVLGEVTDSWAVLLWMCSGFALLACAVRGPDYVPAYVGLLAFGLLWLFSLYAGLAGSLCENNCGQGLPEGAVEAGLIVSALGFAVSLLVIVRRWPRRTPAAWFPDPDDPAHMYRYWDGTRWTEHRSPR